MRVLSVYLHDDVLNTLLQYGTLNAVTNMLLSLYEDGDLDISDLPAAPSREGAKRYNVTVDNATYEEALELLGVNSTQLSLRRILYYAVESDLPSEFGWTKVPDVRTAGLLKTLNITLNKLKKTTTDDSAINLIDSILEGLPTLEKLLCQK